MIFAAAARRLWRQLAWALLFFAFAPQFPARAEEKPPSDAVAGAKAAVRHNPSDPAGYYALARAYLAEGNDAWALKTLRSLAARLPDDCRPALWMAWIRLRQGALEEAREALAASACPAGSPAAARRQILLWRLEQLAGDGEAAKRHAAAARRAEQFYPEDRDFLLRAAQTGEATPSPLQGKLDLQLGWARNARAGSPADPAAEGDDPQSAMGLLALWLRYLHPDGYLARPQLELEARGTGFAAARGRDFSTLTLSLRPGVWLGEERPLVLLAYRGEALLLAGSDRYDDGPLWFTNAHRFELEWNPAQLTVFAGAGRRLFRESGRSRTEIDGGLGGGFSVSRLRLLWAVSGRIHEADKAPYDLRGATGLVSGELKLPARFAFRLGAVLSLDHYPHSAGYFDAAAPDTERRDVLLRLSASVFAPPLWNAVRTGVTYEFAHRESTIGAYDFTDHRVMLKVSWAFSLDPFLPRAPAQAGHVPLDWGEGDGAVEERIQDLLRQDEAAQRSSACLD